MSGSLAGEDPCAALAQGPWTLGQMGQSLDGFIATRTGASHYVTGQASLVHLHRLRALADAVVVGWRTVESDDPRLTVRLVPGDSPARVIVDVRGQLDPSRQVFQSGGSVLHVVGEGCAPPLGEFAPRLERLTLPAIDGRIAPPALVDELRRRGYRRLLVEGGGALVSAFLRAGALDRLHLVVAPLLIGQGRPGVQPAAVDHLADAVRPRSTVYPMGDDVLFDLDLRAGSHGRAQGQ